MITPHLQHVATSLYTKRWNVLSSSSGRSRRRLGLIIYHTRDNSIHYYPEPEARLSADDLQTIFVLMNNALAEQTKLSIN